MANTTFKDVALRIKNSTGWVTLTPYVNQHSLKRTIKLIDDTAYGDANNRFIPGTAGTTASVNGWVNTTTDAITGYSVANVTSVSRSFEMKEYTGRYYNGNTFVSDVQVSGSLNNMQVFSLNLQFDGAVNRTSAALP